MKRICFIAGLLSFLCLLADVSYACTSAIISGKLTPDGRPLMWKHRDTEDLQNCVKYMKGRIYNFIAVVDCSTDNPDAVWIGTNDSGFSIMNTASYNLVEEKDGEEDGGPMNGILMKQALEVCSTVADFKCFLDTVSARTGIEANYGIIDAQGGAAYFEVGENLHYTIYDVNDPTMAPNGYLVRTNYSMEGEFNKGYGYVRYQEAEQNILAVSKTKEITPRWFFKNLSRSYHNPLMGIDLKEGKYNKPETNGWFLEQDFIPRYSSSCAVVIQGVKPTENPDFVVMWTSIGYPSVTPAIPVWLKGADKKLPRLLVRNDETHLSPLCKAADDLRNRVYGYKGGSSSKAYMNWELLYNKQGQGFMQLADAWEDTLFTSCFLPQIEQWRKVGALPQKEVNALYDESDRIITAEFEKSFNLKM